MDPLYDRVARFVAAQTAIRVERLEPDTTIFGDLGIDGDDGFELLENFGREFAVDMSRCDPGRYFGPEGFSLPTFGWFVGLFRGVSPEERAELRPITIADLVRFAQLGRWDIG